MAGTSRPDGIAVGVPCGVGSSERAASSACWMVAAKSSPTGRPWRVTNTWNLGAPDGRGSIVTINRHQPPCSTSYEWRTNWTDLLVFRPRRSNHLDDSGAAVDGDAIAVVEEAGGSGHAQHSGQTVLSGESAGMRQWTALFGDQP